MLSTKGFAMVATDDFTVEFRGPSASLVFRYEEQSHELSVWLSNFEDDSGEPPLELPDALRATDCPPSDVESVSLIQTHEVEPLERLLGHVAEVIGSAPPRSSSDRRSFDAARGSVPSARGPIRPGSSTHRRLPRPTRRGRRPTTSRCARSCALSARSSTTPIAGAWRSPEQARRPASAAMVTTLAVTMNGRTGRASCRPPLHAARSSSELYRPAASGNAGSALGVGRATRRA